MFPSQRGYNEPSPPINVLDHRRQTRIVRFGPFKIGDTKLAGRTLLGSAGRARDQLSIVARLYGRRAADEDLVIIDFTGVNTQADFEFPQGHESLADHYPTRLIVKRGIKNPLVSRGETDRGLATLVLERPTLTLTCLERRTAVEKIVTTTVVHFTLRADGEIFAV